MTAERTRLCVAFDAKNRGLFTGQIGKGWLLITEVLSSC